VQVVVNLISNAVKFSPAGAAVEVRAEARGPTMRVEIRDRGPGVAREYRDVIFEPFRQAEATDSRQKGGTGLGLAICRAIVQQHEGQMGVDDRDGGGSVFWFTVPARTSLQEVTE
jgi:signal transduction histidine kinase